MLNNEAVLSLFCRMTKDFIHHDPAKIAKHDLPIRQNLPHRILILEVDQNLAMMLKNTPFSL
jgi:hypothetical protein